jgi:hypothetical protein
VADVDAIPGKGRQIELSVQSERPVAHRTRYVVPRPVTVAGKKSPPKKEK